MKTLQNICIQWRLRSACASTQSDQNLCYPQKEASICSLATCKVLVEDWSDCADVQADHSLLYVHMSFCWFCLAITLSQNAYYHMQKCICPVWSESSLCTQWVAKDPSFLHADSQDSDQTGWMPRLIWVFVGCTDHFVDFVMRQLVFILIHIES